ncbi:ParM/StbA family protein [Paenibacillus thalictri]|uniref:ParM/StbA family protein n=1 Tax=Paenibacillus thalictri TaxID=2527873 RepID=A0A4Q9DFZ8_9BACL|nr:ParM/StbA family protein [Paenibacillus thalictri]TBL71027.1 ParM/StbA family protein [Paenibacillus thalictri]
MYKIAGIDLGNDSIKLVLDGAQDALVIPNIVSTGYDRHILQEEDSPLKALDVVVYSPALSQNNKRWFVGTLATELEDSLELEETDNKALSDQSLIVALTALAYQGLVSQSYAGGGLSPMDEVEYVLGTGLPVRTFARFHEAFEKRLTGEHEVTFMSTPQLRGRRVKVRVTRTVCSIEGAAAVFNLATHDNLQVRDDEIYSGCIGVCEIGALTTDLPVIRRMGIDNHFSYGEQLGIATYLDSIIRDVEDVYGYSFPTRAKLVQRVKNRDFVIQRIGEGQASIQGIVDQYFSRAAQRIVELIRKRWKKCPDIQCYYVIGGGAAALKSYILEAAGTMRLRFVSESELQNVRGYLKVAKSRVTQASHAG